MTTAPTWIIEAIAAALPHLDRADHERAAEAVADAIPAGMVADAIRTSTAAVLEQRKLADDDGLSREIGNNAAQGVVMALAGYAPTSEQADGIAAWADAITMLERAGVPASTPGIRIEDRARPLTLAERIHWLARQRPAIPPHSIQLTEREHAARIHRETERRASNERARGAHPNNYDHPLYDSIEERNGDK